MRNNLHAIYLGCAGLLIGGLGAAYEATTDGRQPHGPPLFVQAGTTPAPAPAEWQSEWPPANTAVAFHQEMVQLLSPRTTQGTAARPLQSQQAAAPQPQQAASPEVIREEVPEPRSRNSRSSRRERAGEPPVDDSVGTVGRAEGGGRVVIGRDGSRILIAPDGSRTIVDRGRGRDDVEVIGRDGRRYRIDRGDRAEADDEAPDVRRGGDRSDRRRVRDEPVPVERRQPGSILDPFGLFGGGR